MGLHMFNNHFLPEQLNERGEQHVQAAPKAAGIEGGTGEAAFPGTLRPCGMRRVLFIAYRRDLRPAKNMEALAYGRQIRAASAAAGGGSADL